jgi:hypothetical protein
MREIEPAPRHPKRMERRARLRRKTSPAPAGFEKAVATDCGDSVAAFLVLLHLLKCQTNRIAEGLLTHT